MRMIIIWCVFVFVKNIFITRLALEGKSLRVFKNIEVVSWLVVLYTWKLLQYFPYIFINIMSTSDSVAEKVIMFESELSILSKFA